MGKAPATVRFDWAMRFPLESDPSPAKLAYWLERAGDDPWTHDDLLRAISGALDAGEDVPAPLARWALEVLTGRRSRSVQRGPARDPERDMRLAVMVDLMVEAGMSQREAFHRIGEAQCKSPQAIESARRRARCL